MGSFALSANTTASLNVGIGTSSFRNNITGTENTGLGTNSGFYVTSSSNTYVGNNAGLGAVGVSTGGANTGLGNRTLQQITTGSQNTAVGDYAGHNNTTGVRNTSLGAGALDYNNTGSRNTSIGMWSGRTAPTFSSGNDNTYLGYSAGASNITGNNNTILGANANVALTTLNYATAIGSGATVNCNNCLTLGGTTATNRTRVGINYNTPSFALDINQTTGSTSSGIGLRYLTNTWEIMQGSSTNFWFNYNGTLDAWITSGTGAYNAVSDQRLKSNIRPMESILDKVMQLNVSRYEYNRNNPNKIQSIGFLAQQVEPLFPEVVSKQVMEDPNSEMKEVYGMDYAGMSVIAIKAIQEQQKIIEQLTKRIEELEAKSDK
jgi:hypothetical protein